MALKLIVLAAAGVAVATSAAAADLPVLALAPAVAPSSGWMSYLDNVYVHVGPTALVQDAAAKIFANPGPGRIAGATIKIAPNVTAGVEIGYRFTPNWAVSIALGVPPTAQFDGAGTVAALGRLGSTTYGPIAVTGHYHFTNFGAFQPYVGIGPAYMIAFNSKDAAIQNLQVRSAWGFVGQVGFDYMLTDHLGLFVDFKKAYLRTMATGAVPAFAGQPISADVKLDPYIISGGLTYRF